MKNIKRILECIFLTLIFVLSGCTYRNMNEELTIYNVSYDSTRELYEAYNTLFLSYYEEKTGQRLKVLQSHGGSGSQARSVIEGANADVVTLALAHDITLIEEAGLIDKGWYDELEGHSSPYTSTIVFVVHKNNPKQICDWDDLIANDIEIVTPDPKSSGGACWNFLAAWYYAQQLYNNQEQTEGFVRSLYKNVLVMDASARTAATTFVENGQGDVLIAWENDAIVVCEEYPDEYEIIIPSVSILAQPSVAAVDYNVKRNGTEQIANEYLKYLYSDEAQYLFAEYGFRPSSQKILNEYSDRFNQDMKLCTIDDFGGWEAVYQKFFKDGGIFDLIYNE